MMPKFSSLSLIYIRVKEEDRQETFMLQVIMIKEIDIDIDQILDIGEFHLVVEYSMDRFIEIALGMIRSIRMILVEKILEGI